MSKSRIARMKIVFQCIFKVKFLFVILLSMTVVSKADFNDASKVIEKRCMDCHDRIHVRQMLISRVNFKVFQSTDMHALVGHVVHGYIS